MRITELAKGWKVADRDPGEGRPEELSRPGLDVSSWHDITVPGDVNNVLVENNCMPDPHIGEEGRQCYWVTSKEWWFRLEFRPADIGDEPRTDIVLDGVDGHADLYLNGELLGALENAFRPYRFDVSEKLRRDGPNVLLLRFRAIDEVLGGPRGDELKGWGDRRVLMRKPQFSFGWDWSLPLPSVGVMGGIRLENHAGPRIVEASVRGFASGRADFRFRVNDAARDAGYDLRVRVRGHGTDQEKRLHRHWRRRLHTSFFIDNPRLWWPHGQGEPALYDWEVDLVVGGKVLDRRSGRFGFREVRVLEEPFTREAGPGISFWLEVNGRRVFCKGANWVPLELWPAIVTDEQYRFYVRKAVECNFNLLRVWGGGVYERDVFYDLCDESGLMIWQDFMFASAGYPVDRLREEIVAEAEYQVGRCAHHASVVLWCGCNEISDSWHEVSEEARSIMDRGARRASEMPEETRKLQQEAELYSMILRGTVGRHGLDVPYVESSPISHEDTGNLPESGNCHISCWKYALFESEDRPERFRDHFEKVCSFDSEFCIQGPCSVESMKRFLPEGHLWPPDETWTYHIQRGHARIPHHEQTMTIAGALFGEIDGLQKYVKHGQATHAEMMRAEFESARRDRPNNGGTMVWMFNDCWPTSNWSVIDYYRRPKPAYYAARRACAGLLPIIMERGGRVEFFLSNDGPAPVRARVVFGQEQLDGTAVWKEEDTVEVGPCRTRRFRSVERRELDLGSGDYLFIDAVADAGPLPRVTYFPDMWKDVPWPVPDVKLEMPEQKESDGRWITRIRLATDRYARFCHLIVPEAAGEASLDDNFFDISAGRSRVVTVRSANGFDLGDVRVGHWHTDWP